jgi:hypothetical protein
VNGARTPVRAGVRDPGHRWRCVLRPPSGERSPPATRPTSAGLRTRRERSGARGRVHAAGPSNLTISGDGPPETLAARPGDASRARSVGCVSTALISSSRPQGRDARFTGGPSPAIRCGPDRRFGQLLEPGRHGRDHWDSALARAPTASSRRSDRVHAVPPVHRDAGAARQDRRGARRLADCAAGPVTQGTPPGPRVASAAPPRGAVSIDPSPTTSRRVRD